MALSEAERSALYESMREVHGPDVAQSVMTVFPSTPADEPATKRDLDELRVAVRHDVDELRVAVRHDVDELRVAVRHDVDELRVAVRHDVDELRVAVGHDVDELRAELRTDMATIKADLLRTFGTWLFASQAGVIAAVAVLVAFLG